MKERVLDYGIGLVAAEYRRAHLRQHGYDLVVALPSLQYLPLVHRRSLDVVIRQCVILVMLLSRSLRLPGVSSACEVDIQMHPVKDKQEKVMYVLMLCGPRREGERHA